MAGVRVLLRREIPRKLQRGRFIDPEPLAFDAPFASVAEIGIPLFRRGRSRCSR
jgi:hypothetical protein